MAPHLNVVDKSLALEQELDKFYELLESKIIMVDQLLQNNCHAELKFLYDKQTLSNNGCFKSDLE